MVNIWPFFDQITGAGCPLCRAPGDGLCAACLDALPRNPKPCPVCALPLPVPAAPGTLCADCQIRRPAFDRAVAPLLYLAPVDDLVSGFKYQHRLHLGRVLANAVAPTLLKQTTGVPHIIASGIIMGPPSSIDGQTNRSDA